MPTISPREAKPLPTAGGEIAFVDVREHGQYGEGHPFFAVNIPYSRLELRVERLIPRKGVAVILLDDGDRVAEKAARRLDALGYTEVRVLEGGAPAWAAAGFTLYKGVNLPSKAFGELVEHAARTPSVSARELHAMQQRGDAMVLVDGRTPAEYRRMTIPGSRSCPNAELGHRVPAALSDASTPVVVNCAGRTRSIIGAQSLINLGLPNPVFALRNGTQGWTLAGFELERGTEPQVFASLDAAGLEQSRLRADELITRYAIATVDGADLARWKGDDARTLYLFDVRTAEEFEAGHLPGARHAPGGQLVQATDLWVGVRGARIVLCDDTGLRAAQTALWLSRMGHEAYVLSQDMTASTDVVTGAEEDARRLKSLPVCAAASVTARLRAGAVLLDLRSSMEFRNGHVAAARWAIRPRLGPLALQPDADIILAGPRGVAELAGLDLRGQGCENVSVLPGPPEEWRAAGLEIVATPHDPPDADCIDYLFFVHDRHEGNPEAARGYLEWEIALVGQLDEQERGVFDPAF